MEPKDTSVLPSIRAWCKHYGAPDPGEPLDDHLRFVWNAGFVAWLKAHTTVEPWKQSTVLETVFRRDPLPVHPVHQWEGCTHRESYRECWHTYAMQVVLFYAGEVGLGMQPDIDEENPDGGAWPGFLHLCRMLKRMFFGGETKPEAVTRVLKERGIAAQEAA